MMYREDELLKSYAKKNRHYLDVEDEVFFWEEYAINQWQENTIVGLCVNSIPYFCRIAAQGGTAASLLKAHHASMQKDDPSRYDTLCPKFCWGIYAFLAGHSYMDDELGLCHKNDEGLEINKNTLFGMYYDRQKELYTKAHERKYKHYKAVGDDDGKKKLDEAFLAEHLTSENECISKTEWLATNNADLHNLNPAEGIMAILKPLAHEYLSFIEEKRTEGKALLRTKQVEAEKMGSGIEELLNESKALRYGFENAIKYGYMKYENGRYVWLKDRGTLLVALVGTLYCGDKISSDGLYLIGKTCLPANILESEFGLSELSSKRSKLGIKLPPRGYGDMMKVIKGQP